MKTENTLPADPIKGAELISHISTLTPLKRAEYLINHIEPYLHQGLSIHERPDLYNRPEEYISKSGTARVGIFKGEGYGIIVQRAADLFDCPPEDIEAGYEEYRRFVPLSVFREYFDHETDIEINQVINRKNARSLWPAIKSEIDREIRKLERSGRPIKKYVTDQIEKYSKWECFIDPDSSDYFMYFCWNDYINPYLKSCLTRHKKEGELPTLPDCFINKEAFGILKHPQIQELYSIDSSGNYHWNGTEVQLAGLAHRLNNTGKLKADLKKAGLSGPDLAKIFCTFFNEPLYTKAFQPGRAKTEKFEFIK